MDEVEAAIRRNAESFMSLAESYSQIAQSFPAWSHGREANEAEAWKYAKLAKTATTQADRLAARRAREERP